MNPKKIAVCLFVFLFCWIFSPMNNLVRAQRLDQELGRAQAGDNSHTQVLSSSSNLQDDTAYVAVLYTTAYPGSNSILVTLLLKNPVSIAGFEFDIVITPSEMADFSTLQVYVDSIDTCPAPEDTCWYSYPVRECLVVPGEVIEDWDFFEAHGEPGDTTQPDCDILRILGLAFTGTPIPPQSNYVTLFQFGVDIPCVPDSLTDRVVNFLVTGNLSDPIGEMIPMRSQLGELRILWSVPGDANADSLVDVGDVVFLISYLFRQGPQPCVMAAADPNADCQVGVEDVVYLISYLYREGLPPQPGCAH